MPPVPVNLIPALPDPVGTWMVNPSTQVSSTVAMMSVADDVMPKEV